MEEEERMEEKDGGGGGGPGGEGGGAPSAGVVGGRGSHHPASILCNKSANNSGTNPGLESKSWVGRNPVVFPLQAAVQVGGSRCLRRGTGRLWTQEIPINPQYLKIQSIHDTRKFQSIHTGRQIPSIPNSQIDLLADSLNVHFCITLIF